MPRMLTIVLSAARIPSYSWQPAKNTHWTSPTVACAIVARNRNRWEPAEPPGLGVDDTREIAYNTECAGARYGFAVPSPTQPSRPVV
jgi:hypothetical protein